MLAIDKHGDISGACTTSGLAYKMAGQVGDSPSLGLVYLLIMKLEAVRQQVWVKKC